MKKILGLPENIARVFKPFQSLKLVYFFGSRANGRAGKLSDYDFAVYLDEKSTAKRFNLRLKLMSKLSRFLKTDKVDLIVLNDTEMPELKYHVIKDGILIYQKEPFKVLIEPRILNEYFDFREGLRRYGLTKA